VAGSNQFRGNDQGNCAKSVISLMTFEQRHLRG
jgi:hypothetical protein